MRGQYEDEERPRTDVLDEEEDMDPILVSPIISRQFQVLASEQEGRAVTGTAKRYNCVSAAMAAREAHDSEGFTGDWVHSLTELSFGIPSKKLLKFHVTGTKVSLLLPTQVYR